MPTAAKLVSAVLFALIGYGAARQVEILTAAGAFEPILPHETLFGSFALIVSAIGLVSGWLVMGDLVGKGMGVALGSGIQTVVTLVFFAIVLFSIREMILRAMKMRYHGTFEAIQGMLGLSYDYAHVLLNPAVSGLLVVAGAVAGLVVEATARRWR
ncbi:TrgA family protein [Acidimangrovimonas sediminis]|uniref:TrgA family protein n=1 Tax=Acidimangrovimonas sediminis TaxID=2056283 RepID=UPI000C80E212|nr:TrgA family protein [Acidimangrovimonas sediminis]